MALDFACPDWFERLQRGDTPITDLPLDEAEAERAVAMFNKLRVPDLIGQPPMAEVGGEWMRDIVRAAQRLVIAGASALDAVTLAVEKLEDCPLFNAGHGAVFTRDETHELDAAIMDGANLSAGAVACVGRIRRPIRAARAVMEHGEHVLLVAESQGLEIVTQDYFST